MARYFFHVTDNSFQMLDVHGDLCDDEEEVRDNAMGILVQMAKDELPDGDQHDFAVDVTDESGDLVFSADLELRSRRLKRDHAGAMVSPELNPMKP